MFHFATSHLVFKTILQDFANLVNGFWKNILLKNAEKLLCFLDSYGKMKRNIIEKEARV